MKKHFMIMLCLLCTACIEKEHSQTLPETHKALTDGSLVRIGLPDGTEAIAGTDKWNAISHGTHTTHGRLFVAAGNDGIIASSDNGNDWTVFQLKYGLMPAGNINAATFGANDFIIAGQNDVCKSLIYTSGYGTTSMIWNIFLHEKSIEWTSVTEGKDIFVAVGTEGAIAYSDNGENWERATVGTESWRGIAFGNGKFVAVGENGAVACSSDGKSWAVTNYGHNSFKDIAFGNGRFVATAENMAIVSSHDGIGWTVTAEGCGFTDITFGNGYFAAISAEGILVSEDGTFWTEVHASENLHCICIIE